MKHRLYLLVVLCAALLAGCQTAEPRRAMVPSASSTQDTLASDEPLVVTQHTVTIGGKPFDYTATAGYVPLKDDAGKLRARIFFVAYEKPARSDPSKRPITFAFNGGPGASSIWLHVGGIGPKRALLARDGTELPASPGLIDNEFTWLDLTDLVFVDPVGTGFSRAAPGVDPKSFYNAAEDVRSTGEFVRLYVTRFGRWLSPKFIVGESYGTARAVGLLEHLQEHAGVDLDGLMLVSSALDFRVFTHRSDGDLPYVLDVPSFTATAWYHRRLAPELLKDRSQAVAESERWAATEYLRALFAGDALSEADRRSVAEKLAAYTGLTVDYIERSGLRISPHAYAGELLRGQGRRIGMLDSRVSSPGAFLALFHGWFDPSLYLVSGPLAAALNHYLRTDLEWKTDLTYVYLSQEANGAWKYDSVPRGSFSVSDKLAAALRSNERLKVFAAAGLYDLATPYLSQRYVFDHLGLDPKLHDNITFVTYPSGHQIYTSMEGLSKLKSDVAAFMALDLAEGSE